MLAILLALLAAAQIQQPTARVEFEVVSVKPGDPNAPGSSGRFTQGRMEMLNTTLRNLIMNAYHLNEFQLVGVPKWSESAKFNVVATLPEGAASDQTSLMMQSMLADRFKLEFHRETRMNQEYARVVAKGGPKLQQATEEDKARNMSSQGPRMLKVRSTTLSNLARMLISAAGAPVVDRTEISGEYAIDLKFGQLLGGTPADDDLPNIFGAIQQLGLKLEPIKGPVEVLVIDNATMPTEN